MFSWGAYYLVYHYILLGCTASVYCSLYKGAGVVGARIITCVLLPGFARSVQSTLGCRVPYCTGAELGRGNISWLEGTQHSRAEAA